MEKKIDSQESREISFVWQNSLKHFKAYIEQAGAEFGQAQQLVFQIWGLFGFCCQRPAKAQIWFCQELIVEASSKRESWPAFQRPLYQKNRAVLSKKNCNWKKVGLTCKFVEI